MVTSPFTSTANRGLSLATSSQTSPATALLSNGAATGTSSSYRAGAGSTSGSSSSATTNSALSLTPTDFINMMITQLKNQDPLQPTSNGELLQQMSQIGQLQSQQGLQTSLQSMVLQNQIGSASNFIGKSVQGLDVNNNNISGVVDSVHVETGGVNLVLDNGASLALTRVTDVVSGPTGGAAATGGVSGGAGAATTVPTTSTGTTTG